MPPKDNEQDTRPQSQPAAARPESRREALEAAPDRPYALRLRAAQQEHAEEVRAAADKSVPPMADPVYLQPGYVSKAKAADDQALADQEERRQQDAVASQERLAGVAEARRKADEAEFAARRAEYQSLQDARR